MATHTYVPSGTAGSTPTGWTQHNSPTGKVFQIANGTDGLTLNWSNVNFAGFAATLDAPGTVDLAGGFCEVYVDGYFTGAGAQQAVGLLGMMPVPYNSNDFGYGFTRNSSSGTPANLTSTSLQVVLPFSAAFNNLYGVNIEGGYLHNTRYRQRWRTTLQGDGTTVNVKYRIWLATDSEPGTWDIDQNHASGRKIGRVGVYGMYAHNNHIYFMGVGTNGDAAPTSAGPAPATSVSATSRPYPVVTADHEKSARTVSFSASATFSAGVRVTWTAGDPAATHYVHRLAAGASAPTDASTRTSGAVSAGTALWDDPSPTAGTAYDYYVEAVSGGSSFSVTPANVAPSTSGVSITGWAWDFTTNGSTDSTAQNPEPFTYPADGSYTATVTATASNGTSDSDTESVTLASEVFEEPRYRVAGKFLIETPEGDMGDDLSEHLAAASWWESIDNPTANGEFEMFLGSSPAESWAPMMEASENNRDEDGAYALRIDVGRRVLIQTAVTDGSDPLEADFRTRFDGVIRELDPGDGRLLRIDALDLGARLMWRWITEERQYGSAAPGTDVYTVMQAILDDELGDGVVTLYTVNGTSGSPINAADLPAVGIGVGEYVQQKEPILTALRALALRTGLDVRYRWNADTELMQLTVSEPERTATVPVHTFGPNEYIRVERALVSIMDVRTKGRNFFIDQATGTRQSVEAVDSVAVARYGGEPWGILWFEIEEPAGSPINNADTAQRFIDSAVSDLSLPDIEHTMLAPYYPDAELGALYGYLPNGAHYDTAQALACVGYRQVLRFGGDGADPEFTTTIDGRGKPSGGIRTWIRNLKQRGVGSGTPGSGAGGGTALPQVDLSLSVSGLNITAAGNSSTYSLKAERTDGGGSWSEHVDGRNRTFAVPVPSSSRWTVTVTAYGAPAVDVTAYTPSDSESVVLDNGAGGGLSWTTCTLAAPGIDFSTATLTLQAASAPGGHTVQVTARSRKTGETWVSHGDITGDLSPALSAPPTSSTDYTFDTGFTRAVGTYPYPYLVEFEVTAAILNGSSVAVGSQPALASWAIPTYL